MSLLAVVLTLRRETMGENLRGSVRKAIPAKSTVVVNTLRRPFTIASPKLGSKKYFCFNSHVTNSFAPEGVQFATLEAWEVGSLVSAGVSVPVSPGFSGWQSCFAC